MSILPDVHICPFMKTSAPPLPEATAKCKLLAHIGNSQGMSTEINKNGAVVKVKILLKKVVQSIQE